MKRILENPEKIRTDFCIHPERFIICVCTVLASLILGITYLVLKNWPGVLVMLVICGLFLWQGWIYGPWVSITCDGIRKHIFGWTLASVRWDELKEVGVVGTKVFNKLNSDKTGPMYIYFSPKEMTTEERFQLALNFPPKHMLFLLHNQEREDLVQALWNTKLIGYNTGKLNLRHPEGEEKADSEN